MMAIRGARVTRWRTAALRIALEIVLLAVVATVYGACSVPSFGFRDEAIVSDGGPGSDVSDAAPPNHCLDQIQDQDETGTDCGGSCTPCAPGLGCIQNTDCDSSVCEGGSCSQPTCSDGVLNGDETERDCGGSRCPKCAPGQACKVDTDCVSSSCQAHLCALSCLPGQGDCDGDITTACEANLQTDALHCGDCATPCILAHASAVCSGGKCLVDEC